MTSKLNIVAFVCENHVLSALKAASTAGDHLPESVSIVKLPCTGRLETTQILDTLREGADGVAIIGCLEENCYHDIGSMLARGRVDRMKELLKDIGIEPDRVEMFNIASVSGSLLMLRISQFETKLASLPSTPFKGVMK
ncbi:MAG: hydrogenase iron-sulfur subunit [Thermoplasmata archaeon]|nr:hydrogenase iron-sulfur subunit [Thermoplasmata archaeon]